MTTGQWARVKVLFHDALGLPPERQQVWLAGLDGEDPEVRDEAMALLRAHAAAAEFLEHPAAVDPDDLMVEAVSEGVGAPLPAGLRIGDYEIRREIGRGGMGVVYLAHDVHLSRPAALKAVPSQLARDPDRLNRLRREAQAAAAINHPGVAMVYAFLPTPHGHFIASEFIQGRTLREEVDRGPLESLRAVRLAIEIVQALVAAHDARVVHRDLKPENVLITAGGGVKVIDFGIARLESYDAPDLTVTATLQGTPGYMAPEQFVPNARVDGRADLYAVGIILAEMVLGRHPFERPEAGLPAPLQAITSRCLESDPARRFKSARDLLHELERASRLLEAPGGLDDSASIVDGSRSARWWWQFHQVLAAVVYWFLIAPAWYAREFVVGPTGRMLFFATLGASLVASILRLHLWFTSRTDPGGLTRQMRSERIWIVAADSLFGVAMVTLGVLVGDKWMSLAVVLLTAGIGAAVVSIFIEPTTARAAFPEGAAQVPATR